MSSIKKQLFSGVFYTALSKYSGIVVSLIVTAILARLLSPDDFGVVAIASVVISFFNIFTDIGLSAAIIQHKNLSKQDLSDLFTFTFWCGIILAGGFFILSIPIANYYEHSILSNICKILSVNLFFSSVSIVPNALFYKNKEFRYIAIRSLSIQFAGGIFSVVFALLGGGIYALLINPVLSCILLFIISIKRYPQRLSLFFNISPIRKIFSYSVYQFLFGTIVYFSRNLDKLLIGKYLNMTALGYYEKSYRLMMLPLQNITQVITPVMHPILSDLQDDKRQLTSAHEKIVKILAAIGFPLSVFLFFSAREIILFLFGEQWIPSISVFQILSLSVGMQIVLSSSGSIFQAAGDTKSLFVCGLFSALINTIGILLGVFYFKTLDAIAISINITVLLGFIQSYIYMYVVTLKQSIYPFIKLFVLPLIISLVFVIVFFIINHYTAHINIVISLSIKSLIFVIIWGIYIQYTGIYDVKNRITKLVSHQSK